MFSKAILAAALATVASAATVNIAVSDGEGSLKYSPNSVTANVGDTVVFTFAASGHSVAQGSGFSNACQPMSSGFFSGESQPPTTFSIDVKDTNPIFFYCSTPGHCQRGMVGAINPGSNSVADYAKAAGSASSNNAPSGSAGTGGTLGKAGSSSGGSSSSAGSSSTVTMSMAASGTASGSASGSASATGSSASASTSAKSDAITLGASAGLALFGGLVAALL